ncbi:MAG: hypothetical protein IH963_05730 [Chloroflexi bacterium]|nr:hypothetical protein [Chloroflexota bacterium]
MQYSEHIKNIATVLAQESNTVVKYALKHSDPNLASYSKAERPSLCYEWDRRMVEEADLVVAEASFPSTGMGIELQIANDNNTPILLIYSDFWRNREAEKFYRTDDETRHQLQIGSGIVSIMVQGLPMVKQELLYVNPATIEIELKDALTTMYRQANE